MDFKKVLVLAPHTDDEFGCCGTLGRLLEGGSEVFYAAFSTCRESVPEGFPKDVLAHEVRRATEVIGIPSDHVLLYDFRVRHFPAHRQEILEELVQLRKQLNPDLVLVPSASDVHQDHHIVAREALRAFKFASVLGYELPWNNLTFQHSCFVELEPHHLERKIQALGCYASQAFRQYSDPDFIRALAKVRGVQAGVKYAESFEVQRLKF